MSDWRIQLTEVELSDREIEAVMDALRSTWLTMGPRTQELEAAFADYIGTEHAIALSSGSAALHLACAALGLGEGDEVIVPALSFVAGAHAPRLTGATPVLADLSDPRNPVLGVGEVEARITDRTRAVILVHMFGYSAPAEEITALCAERGISVIEDCAQSVGAELHGGSKAGAAGDCGCFSLFSKSPLGVGEGGLLVTDDAVLAARVRSLRSHAMTSVTWDRHRGHAETYDVVDLGFNYRLDEPRSALALARLAGLDANLVELRRVVHRYRELLAGLEGVELCFEDAEIERAGHFAFPVLLADLETRDAVRKRMAEQGVQSTAYPAITRLSEYADAGDAPVSEEVADRHISLPVHPRLEDEGIETVVAALRSALD